MRTYNSATWRSKSRAMRDWPSSLMQFILLSTRLRRWYPDHCRQMERPRYFEARRASFRANAPGLVGFHGLAFLRGGMTTAAFRAAIASWHLRVS